MQLKFNQEYYGNMATTFVPEFNNLNQQLEEICNKWKELDNQRNKLINNLLETNIETLDINKKYTIKQKKELIFAAIEVIRQYIQCKDKYYIEMEKYNKDRQKNIDTRKQEVIEGMLNLGFDIYKIEKNKLWQDDTEYKKWNYSPIAINITCNKNNKYFAREEEITKAGYDVNTDLKTVEIDRAIKYLGELWKELE